MGYRILQYKYCIHDGTNEYDYEYEWLGETYSRHIINRYLHFSGNMYIIAHNMLFFFLESFL